MSVNGEPTRVSHAFVKKNMVRYMRPRGWFAHCSCKNAFMTYPRPRPVSPGRGFVLHLHTRSAPTARFGLLYQNILFWTWLTGLTKNGSVRLAFSRSHFVQRFWKNGKNAEQRVVGVEAVSRFAWTKSLGRVDVLGAAVFFGAVPRVARSNNRRVGLSDAQRRDWSSKCWRLRKFKAPKVISQSINFTTDHFNNGTYRRWRKTWNNDSYEKKMMQNSIS